MSLPCRGWFLHTGLKRWMPGGRSAAPLCRLVSSQRTAQSWTWKVRLRGMRTLGLLSAGAGQVNEESRWRRFTITVMRDVKRCCNSSSQLQQAEWEQVFRVAGRG